MWIIDFILFLDPPTVLHAPKPVEGIEGEDASLHCEFDGTGPFEINWFKDGAKLTENKRFIMANKENSVTLYILGLEKSDGGEYVCKASNQVGNVQCSVSITLRG